ncbi:hypothetical protein [Streptomyces sp. NPDC127112]|uniref:hypothetical protein n=1 Tax=Streptomyces sp. NPDC127112 TaxID=3345364 RepID=UPI00363FB520
MTSRQEPEAGRPQERPLARLPGHHNVLCVTPHPPPRQPAPWPWPSPWPPCPQPLSPAHPDHLHEGNAISTRSFIARPTGTGYEGIYCHYDGYPDHQLPLLLGAARYRFGGDLDALRRHLIDGPHDWRQLGVDLLDRAPDNVRERLDPHGDLGPSAPFDNVFNVDGTPAKSIPITDANADAMGLEWGYVLHDHGIEVIALTWYDVGPIVPWDTDPLSRISGTPSLWESNRPAPIQAPATLLKIAKPVAPVPAPARSRITR